jgi:4-amino-4-deoxy-L-arabinose transferase-like glycosyltransferase
LEIDRVFGLPAHPLFAHAPVVLIPLTALLALACVASARWRDRLGWLTVGLAAASLAFVQLAISTGEAFQESVRETGLVERHAGMADTMRPIAAVLFLAVTAMVVADRVLRRRDAAGSPSGPSWVMPVLAVLVVLSAGFATAWVVRTGHSGARAVWDHPQTAGAP